MIDSFYDAVGTTDSDALDNEDSTDENLTWVERCSSEFLNRAKRFLESPCNQFVHKKIVEVLLKDQEIIGLQAFRRIIEEAAANLELNEFG